MVREKRGRIVRGDHPSYTVSIMAAKVEVLGYYMYNTRTVSRRGGLRMRLHLLFQASRRAAASPAVG
jgi:hypothetical protein